MKPCILFVEMTPPWGAQVCSTLSGNYVIYQSLLCMLDSQTPGCMALVGAVVPQQQLMGPLEVTISPGDRGNALWSAPNEP